MSGTDGSANAACILRAVRLACERHAEQRKPRQRRSVIDHILEVAQFVSEVGFPAEVVAAAVLHDTLEKTKTDPEELEQQFSPTVRSLVEAVSDAEGEPKPAVHARLKSAPAEAQSIKCADIVSNLEALARAGELTAKDLDDKAATLAILTRAHPSLAERAASIIERGVGE